MNSDHKKINLDHKKKNKINRRHLPFTRHFVFFFLMNSWLRKLILFLLLLILMIH